MRLTKEEWDRAAEIAAAHKHGEDHAGWYQFRRYGAKPAAVLAVVGALGYGAYWLWTKAVALLSGDLPSPAFGVWTVLAVLLVLTAVAYRPGRLPSFGAGPKVKAAAFVIAWLALISYMIGSIA